MQPGSDIWHLACEIEYMGFKLYRTKELDWIEGCKKRDPRAQKLLYECYAPRMYALCCRYIPSRTEAEDVLVIAFTKIFERIGQYKGEGSFEGWIRKIMVNESLSYLRRNKNMYLEEDIDTLMHEPDLATLENHLEAEDLIRLMSQMPAGYRMIFNLYAIDGFSHKEIAMQLGISENTSKSQLSRARVFLQKMLAKLESEVVLKSKYL